MQAWKLTLGDSGPSLISPTIGGLFPELEVGETELSPGQHFKVECVEMSEAEMNALPEFDGF